MRSEAQLSLRSLPIWLKLFAVFWMALAVYWQWLAHSDGIFGEMWDTLPAFQKLGQLGVIGIAQELLRKYAQIHIIALPKLVFWMDFEWFGASGRFTRTCSFLASFACAVCLWRIALRDFQRPVLVSLIALLLFFNALQAYVISWESLLQYYLSVLFALLAFMVYWQSSRYTLLSCVLLFFSAFSCGSGIAAIAGFTFMLAIHQWREKLIPPRLLAIYSIFVLVMVNVLLPDAPVSVPIGEEQPFFWNAPNLLLQYLAFPFSAWGDCRWLGILVIAFVLHSVWCCVWLRQGLLSDCVLIFFFLVACTIALGRYRFMAMDADVSRYYVYIAPIWFFIILKLLQKNHRVSSWLAGIVVASIVVASAASAVVLGNLSNKMNMARVVALNGNMKHLASQRLDAMHSQEATLENSRDYLRERNMDIYYNLRKTVENAQSVCRAHLVSQSFATKGMFINYVLREDAGNAARLQYVYLTDLGDPSVKFYGVSYAEITHAIGWNILLKDVEVSDWPLLLPPSWLPVSQRLLLVPLPRAIDPSKMLLWADDYHGNVCRLLVDN